MEILVALFLLYALQCSALLPRGCVLFVRVLGAGFERAGPGFGLQNPRPSARSLVGSRLPLTLRDGRLHSAGAPAWWQENALGGAGPRFDPGASEAVEAKGRSVRAGKQRLARGLTTAHAARLAHFLDGLRGCDERELSLRVETWLAASFDLAALRAALERVDRALRWLDGVLDVYALLALCAIPGAALLLGVEPVLWRALPLLLALQLAALVCFVRAQRKLEPGRRGELLEMLLAASLYPPLLLRASNELAVAQTLRFQPATLACAVLPREEALALLRRELQRCRQADAAGVDWLRAGERRGLEALVAALGESMVSLFAAPMRQDALATGFCPACRVEYRRAEGECADCGEALRAFDG